MIFAKELHRYQFLTGYSAYEDFSYLVKKYVKSNPSVLEKSFVLEEPQAGQVSGT